MLAPQTVHRWECTPKEAVMLQASLASQAVVEPSGVGRADTVAGIDVSVVDGQARAAVVVMRLDLMEALETVRAQREVSFPYVPGLLSFREGPVILDALGQLETTPDVLLFDGQGRAHPRRFGIATHIGVLLDRPSVGCAKSRLCGTHEQPGEERGSYSPLWDDSEQIGAVLRTRSRVKPVYVSVGHRATLAEAIELVLRCGTGCKLPEPIRQAHRAASLAGSA